MPFWSGKTTHSVHKRSKHDLSLIYFFEQPHIAKTVKEHLITRKGTRTITSYRAFRSALVKHDTKTLFTFLRHFDFQDMWTAYKEDVSKLDIQDLDNFLQDILEVPSESTIWQEFLTAKRSKGAQYRVYQYLQTTTGLLKEYEAWRKYPENFRISRSMIAQIDASMPRRPRSRNPPHSRRPRLQVLEVAPLWQQPLRWDGPYPLGGSYRGPPPGTKFLRW